MVSVNQYVGRPFALVSAGNNHSSVTLYVRAYQGSTRTPWDRRTVALSKNECCIQRMIMFEAAMIRFKTSQNLFATYQAATTLKNVQNVGFVVLTEAVKTVE